MIQRRGRAWLLLSLCGLVAAGTLGTLWLVNQPQRSHPKPDLTAGQAADASDSDFDSAAPVGPATPDVRLQKMLADAGSDAGRVAVLDSLAAMDWARSDLRPLQDSMLLGQSTTLRAKAFDVTLVLATREGAAQTVSVLDRAIQNPHAEVRLAAFRACKAKGSPALVPRLVEAADTRPDERFLVIDALATIADPQAHAKVLQTAQDEKLPRAERLRAIALLSKTRHNAGLEYLTELASGEDDALRNLAMETLAAIQSGPQTTK